MNTVNTTSNYQALCDDIIKHTIDKGVNYSREELENLFENTEYFNGGEKGKAEIQKQIDALEKTIAALKKEAEDLQKQIDGKNIKVEQKTEKMTDIIDKINNGTANYQKEIKDAARLSVREAIEAFRKSDSESFEQCFSDALNKKMSQIAGVDMAQIKAWYTEYDSIKSTLKPVMSDIQKYITQVKGIQTKLNTTNATINLLTITKNNMTDTIKGVYKNVDTDTKVPVYSGAKAKVANDIIAKYSLPKTTGVGGAEPTEHLAENANDGTANANANQTSAEKMANYAAQNNEKYGGGAYYATYRQNPEVRNLCEAVKNGMLEDLQASGASVDDIMKFISENWNVGILRNVDSKGQVTYTIPNKNDSGKEMYDKLSAFAATGTATSATGTTPTEANVPKTHLENLKQNGEKALDELYGAGFTFKEAMYVFNQIFGQAGVTYDLNAQKGMRNYGILIDDETSGNLYKTLATKIKNYWNVDTSNSAATTGIKAVRGNNDPIVFQDGDTTYTFINDRDGDGEFDYTDGQNNELLGSENGIAELLEFDYYNDGVIDEKDSTIIDGKTVFALDQITLISNHQVESVGENGSKDVDGYKTGANYKDKGVFTNSVDFDVSYTSARQLGITSINLKAIKDSGKINGEDNVDERYNDVNGSNVINEFTITKNGKEITAQETLNTDANLDLFYGQIAEKAASIKSGINSDQFNSAFENWYNSDAKETAAILNKLAAELDALAEEAQKEEGSHNYDLNYSWEEFEKLYGEDGKSGTYIEMVKETASAKSKKYADNEKNGININYKDEDANSNSSRGADAAENGLKELNEKVKIKVD